MHKAHISCALFLKVEFSPLSEVWAYIATQGTAKNHERGTGGGKIRTERCQRQTRGSQQGGLTGIIS